MTNYSSISEVLNFTQHLLQGQATFNSTTNPNSTAVSKFLDYASNELDGALAQVGFTIPVTQVTAKVICDAWVTARAVEYVELTQRGVGFGDQMGSRSIFSSLFSKANDFVQEKRQGFARLGVPITHKVSAGLSFTGLDVDSERDDPSDSGLAQPKFKRGLFDASGSGYLSDTEDS